MRSIFLYLLLVGVPVLVVLKILQAGERIFPAVTGVANLTQSRTGGGPDLTMLLVQVVIVLAVSRLVGRLFRSINQAQVMGEMAAGILLGPSVLGALLPSVSSTVFPAVSLGSLQSLSYVGLALYMFLVGLRLDLHTLRRHKHTAFITSHVSIILPFTLGVLVALYLYGRLADNGATFIQFALFLGTAMSITAFPVLARILTDRKLLHTPVGTVAIACAAVDDITAWFILAGVVLLVRVGSVPVQFWAMLAGSAGYILIMLLGVRRLLVKLQVIFKARQAVSHDMLAIIMLIALASAWVTESLGIHALFGAFMAGVIMPKDKEFVRVVFEKLAGIIVVLFLPLFFALTGLRTSIGLLAEPAMWGYCGLIIAVAIVGKFGGSTISTRLNGMSWRESAAVGTLMNTRGLMELVVLNVGLDIGAISQTVFTMMVLMAFVTTFMATPLLELIYPARIRTKPAAIAAAAEAV